MSELSTITKFIETFAKLENCNYAEQKIKIDELKGLIDAMNEKEFQTVITEDFYYDLNDLIARCKLSLENIFPLLMHIGYSKVLAGIKNESFDDSFLRRRFEFIMVDEMKKKQQNGKLVKDLCGCFASLSERIDKHFRSWKRTIKSYFLRIAIDLNESKCAQKDKEIALLLACHLNVKDIDVCYTDAKDFKELIRKHLNSRNLSQLAFRSALHIYFIKYHDILKEFALDNDEIHFARESTEEIEKLAGCVNWKKKDITIKEMATIGIIERWCSTICVYTEKFNLDKEESVWFVMCATRLIELAKDNHRSTVEKCITIIVTCMDRNSTLHISDFFGERTIGFILEEMCKFNSDNQSTDKRMIFLSSLTERLKKNVGIARDKKKKIALKMTIQRKLEEEGYEDLQISFNRTDNDQY